MEPDTWDSINMADALHPQMLLCYGMNSSELPVVRGVEIKQRGLPSLPKRFMSPTITWVQSDR